MVKPRAKEAEHSRTALINAARRRFAKKGQAGVEVLPVTRDAKLTTGALYHHFGSRQGLLRAVLEDTAALVAERARVAMAGHSDTWQQVNAGVQAVLDACLEPAVRMTYNEAPSILGLDGWRAMEESHTGVLLVGTLARLEAEGGLVPGMSLPLLASMLKGAIVEGAMFITRSKQPKVARKEAGELLERMLLAARPIRPSRA